jgi:predicted nucleic acid-binding Zn ribbon protein
MNKKEAYEKGEDLNSCKECGQKLKIVKHIRHRQKLCPDCRGSRTSGSQAIRDITEDLKKRNANLIDEDDWSTQDDPRAEAERDYGRVRRVSNAAPTETTLSELF